MIEPAGNRGGWQALAEYYEKRVEMFTNQSTSWMTDDKCHMSNITIA